MATDQGLLEQIHLAREKVALAVTGGGASAVARLLSVPGASKSLLAAWVPYHPRALRDFIMSEPESACSGRTARQMAMAAYERGRRWAEGAPVVGLGATAALATDRQRRGADCCFIAVHSRTATREAALELDKSHSREAQEAQVADAIIIQLAEALGLDTPLAFDLDYRIQKADAHWQALHGDAPATDAEEEVKALLPGSFNPIHAAHLGMAQHAEQRLGCKAHLELSVRNVDKPPLDYLEMADRRRAMGKQPLVFTNTPTFIEKARLFPGAVFLVGTDTLARINQPRYYASPAARDAAIKEIGALGNRFLVFGRQQNRRFLGLADLQLAPALAELCDAVPEKEFRVDLSSSSLRKAGAAKGQQ